MPNDVPLGQQRPAHPRGEDRRGRKGGVGPAWVVFHRYDDAGHAFSNREASSLFNQKAVDLAWSRSLAPRLVLSPVVASRRVCRSMRPWCDVGFAMGAVPSTLLTRDQRSGSFVW